MKKISTLLGLIVLLCSSAPCQETEALSIGAAYVSDWGRNFTGGIKSGNFYMGLIDFGLSLNSEKAGLWKGGELYIQAENTHGSTPTADIVCDLQAFSNIEGGDFTYLYMLWYKHSIGDLTAIAGVHDLNSEFVATEYGGAFINSSFGIMPAVSLNFPVSIFPKNALGLVLQYGLSDNIFIQTAVYDGDPGSLDDDPYNLDLTINDEQGFLSITEIQLSEPGDNSSGTYKLGFQYHSGDFLDYDDTTQVQEGNWGVYFIGDKAINNNAGAFLQMGYANPNYNLNHIYIGGGVNIKGFSGREDDLLGIGFAMAGISNKFIGFDKDHETSIELTYHLQIHDNIILQPDMQYIINPGAISGTDNAFVGLMRFIIEI